MGFQKGGKKRKFKAMAKGKIAQPCKIVISPVNGTISFQAPHNEDFNKEFLAAIDHKKRQWDPDKKIWRALPELLTVVIDIAQRHYSNIEGLDAIYMSDYDVIGVSEDMPMAVIKATVKALRIAYAPDRAPDHLKAEYTDKLQSIADALSRIEAERQE